MFVSLVSLLPTCVGAVKGWEGSLSLCPELAKLGAAVDLKES